MNLERNLEATFMLIANRGEGLSEMKQKLKKQVLSTLKVVCFRLRSIPKKVKFIEKNALQIVKK